MSVELETKLSRIKTLLASRNLDALLIRKVNNFAWLAGGAASYVNTADSLGAASLLVTSSNRYLITDNIEAPRLRFEEGLENQGWEFVITDWYQAEDEIARLTRGMRLGTDGAYAEHADLSAELIRLRMNLLPAEQARFRALSKQCSSAMDDAIHRVKPGMSEFEIAGLLSAETQRRGVQPIVILIATDQRIYDYRHPLPTDKKLDKYAMLVLCGRYFGLVCSITRLVHFGKMPDELRRRAQAVAEIDAVMIAATRPGVILGDIFKKIRAKYAQVGYEDQWRNHHQGGPAGYLPREMVATPGADFLVETGQIYAWNPTIAGTKSEDTILVAEEGNDILTQIPDWPLIAVEVNGETILRPATLEII